MHLLPLFHENKAQTTGFLESQVLSATQAKWLDITKIGQKSHFEPKKVKRQRGCVTIIQLNY